MTAERNFQKSNCCFYGKIQKIAKNCHNPKKRGLRVFGTNLRTPLTGDARHADTGR